MFNDEVQTFSADVCMYFHTERWIKPNYVSLSFLAAILLGVSCWFLAIGIGQFFFVSTSFKCTFVVWFSFVKEFFVEMSEIRRPMAAGRCFIIIGRWLELVSMKRVSSLGFLYG